MDRGHQAPPHGSLCAAVWARCRWSQSFACGRFHARKLEPAPVPEHILHDWYGLSYGYTQDMTNQLLQHHAVANLYTKMIKQHEDGTPRQTEPRAFSTAGLYWVTRTRATRAARVHPAIPAYAGTNKAMTGNPPRCSETLLHQHIQVSQYDMDVAVAQRYSKQANPNN